MCLQTANKLVAQFRDPRLTVTIHRSDGLGATEAEERSRPVDRRFVRRLLMISLLILLVGSFDEFAVDKGGAGPGQGNEVKCVQGVAIAVGLTRSV